MSENKYLLIKSRNHGFFSNYLHTLDRIIYAEKRGLIPVVAWGLNNDFLYKDLQFEKEMKLYNCWDYYFESTGYSISDAQKDADSIVAIVNDFSEDQNVPYCFMKQGGANHLNKIDIQTFSEKRKFLHSYVEKFFIPKSQVIRRIDNFYNAEMSSKKVLSIHIRGTDRKQEIINNMNSKIENYSLILEEFAEKYDKIFVCSDSWESIKFLERKYGNKIIYFDSFRSEKHDLEQPIHFSNGNYRTGEDVLCESILMSRTDFLINSDSNVTLSSLYMNPNLEFRYYDYKALTI